ncbi:MAG TPA: endonuclease/exonuclease/phosphatase family protein [Rhodothermales bacterium]
MHRFLRLIVPVVGWLVTIAFAGAYAAYYVRPGWLWWLQVLALAMPFIVMLLFVTTLAAFSVKKRLLGFVQIGALILIGLRNAPFGLLEREPAEAGLAPIEVLTYNTHGGMGYWAGEDGGVIDLVKSVAPDVACLQEFGAEAGRGGPGTASVAFSGLGYRQVTRMPRGRRETKRPILSRFAVRESQYLPLSQGDESYAVRAVLESDSGTFSVYNVHLRGFSPNRPWREGGNVLDPRDWIEFFRSSGGAYVSRAHEAARLREYLDQETHPFLVCGDFNSTPNQWTYHRIAAGLKDAFQVAGEGWGKTYHARLPIVRIDFVFASNDWEILSADVLDTGISDHRAVVAVLGLR